MKKRVALMLVAVICAALTVLLAPGVSATECVSDGEQHLIVNGDFSAGDATGWVFEVGGSCGPDGEYEIADQKARIHRVGAESCGGGAWLYQAPNADVQDAGKLTLSFKVRVDYQSLPGLDWENGEAPGHVEIRYRDVYGNEKYACWAFYYADTTGTPPSSYVVEKIPQGVWVARSYDLTLICPRIAVIERVYVMGAGWDYDSRFDNVSIVCGTDQLEIAPASPSAGTPWIQARPNPFNPSVQVEYGVSKAGRVQVQVWSVDGQLVRTIEDTERSAGTYTAAWDGRDQAGEQVSSGLYLCRLIVNEGAVIEKLMLIR